MCQQDNIPYSQKIFISSNDLPVWFWHKWFCTQTLCFQKFNNILLTFYYICCVSVMGLPLYLVLIQYFLPDANFSVYCVWLFYWFPHDCCEPLFWLEIFCSFPGEISSNFISKCSFRSTFVRGVVFNNWVVLGGFRSCFILCSIGTIFL